MFSVDTLKGGSAIFLAFSGSAGLIPLRRDQAVPAGLVSAS
jgi:hypothetical protein